MPTTIQISDPVKKALERMKMFKRETYNDVIENLIEDNMELKLLSYSRPHIIIEDRNSNFFLCGLEHGMEVTGGSIATGTAFGDLSGYSLTLTGQELEPANFIRGGTSADPFANMVSATVTVTVGTNS